MPISKSIRDTKFAATKYQPAAAATNYTDAFDLEAAAPAAEPNLFECELVIPAMANHTDTTKTITHTLQDSANGSSFANVDPLIQAQTPGVASTGSVARTLKFRVPSTTRQHIRIAQAVPSADGDVTGDLTQFNLLF